MLRAARGLSAGHGMAIDVDVSKHCSEGQLLLKERGLDYHETEIPDHALKLIKDKFPDTWEEYIKVY